MTFNQGFDPNEKTTNGENSNTFNFLNPHASSFSAFDDLQKQHQTPYQQYHHNSDPQTRLNAQQQQYLLQLQIQQNQAQLQAQANQSQLQSQQSHQKRAYSQVYPNFSQSSTQQPTPQSSAQSNEYSFNSDLSFSNLNNNLNMNNGAGLFDHIQSSKPINGEFRISPHSSFALGSNNESLLSSQNMSNNQFIASNNFTLPVELQGGVNTIFNRRPSYAADLVNSNHDNFAAKQYQLQLSNINTLNSLNSLGNNNRTFFENSDKRKNSIDFSALPVVNPFLNVAPTDLDQIYVQLDDGLLLNKATNTIITSPNLVKKFEQCSTYFGDYDEAMKIVDQLNKLLGLGNIPCDANFDATRKKVDKLLEFLLKQNEDLKSSNHMGNKNYSLILNKNGRLDIISFPKNSNLQLMSKDLIIIEGDRGKDLVMVLKPVIDFKFALFFNYLKKKLHLKSLEFGNSSGQGSNPSSRSSNSANSKNSGSSNLKSIINEDENFITLPNKQILRFAKPYELNQLVLKYNDEIMAYRICLNYSATLNLDLIIKNVEFQFDKKKLIIYYYCLQRLDFRGLIKELFKIYKTRIWLCAILPLERSYKPLLEYELEKQNIKPQDLKGITDSEKPTDDTLYVDGNNDTYRSNTNVVQDKLPSSDQIYQFSEISDPIYFHSKIFSNLIKMFEFEISNHELFGDRYWFLNDE
ncbi:hypothetical protein CANINC_003751 [Pichia inconspicua]|uniref:PSP1 C-terminal domain-containing protein n=1 Tax=Pichia inconspicua TaxID=52247 RepID=A0A4T0WXS2_9ASCO|nr:hypothetical protein CANINC_003751 [[Candida] inconspicua]